MPQLPFVHAPKPRTQLISVDIDGDTYSLEFPVKGCLMTGERIDIRDADYQAAVNRECSRLADALVAEGIEETEAQRLSIRCLATRLGIPAPLEAAEQRILLRHAPLVAEIQATLAADFAQQQRRTVTALIAHRLPACRGWTAEDTDAKVPGPLFDAIVAFAEQERNANQPQRTPEELIDSMVETLGKLGPDSSQSPPTGPASTGAAGSSGPVLPSSAESASPPSRSTTSSRRSKKASAAA